MIDLFECPGCGEGEYVEFGDDLIIVIGETLIKTTPCYCETCGHSWAVETTYKKMNSVIALDDDDEPTQKITIIEGDYIPDAHLESTYEDNQSYAFDEFGD